MTDTSEDTEQQVEAPEVEANEPESPQDAGLAAFAALEAKRGLGLEDDDDYAAKDSDEADAFEDDATDAGGPGEKTASAGEESGQADPAEREAAIRALRRAKTPQSVIDGLDDDALLKWGQQLAQIQSDVDKKLSAKTASEPEEDESAPQEAADTPAPAQADAAADFDWDTALAPLKDTFGDRDAEAVAAPIKAAYGQLAQQNLMLSNAIQELLVRDQFRQLTDAYPQLADPAQQQAVKDKARSLNHGEYQSLDDLIRDAARLALGDPRNADQERRSSVSRKRSASQTRTTNRKVPSAAMSDYERNFERFKEIEQQYGLG